MANIDEALKQLTQDVQVALENVPLPCSEYELIQYLTQNKALAFIPKASANLTLFYKHFAIMHALYTLQTQLLQKNLYLDISPIAIQITPITSSNSHQINTNSNAPLVEYYLDLNHWHNATEQTVAEWLASFWRKLSNDDARPEACEVLGVPEDATQEEIEKAYRKKVQEYHPDKGGDVEEFVRVREAYEAIKNK